MRRPSVYRRPRPKPQLQRIVDPVARGAPCPDDVVLQSIIERGRIARWQCRTYGLQWAMPTSREGYD